MKPDRAGFKNCDNIRLNKVVRRALGDCLLPHIKSRCFGSLGYGNS